MKNLVILFLFAFSVLLSAQDRNQNQDDQSNLKGNLRLEYLENSRKLDELTVTLKKSDAKIDKLEKKITAMEENMTRINYYLWIGGGFILVMLLIIMFRIIIPAAPRESVLRKKQESRHSDDDEAREKISIVVDELANLERHARQESQKKSRRR